MTKLGEQLRALREVKRKSVRRAAQDTGLSNAYLSQLERGIAKNPSPHLLNRLSDYYGAPHDALMSAAGYVKSSPKSKVEQSQSSLEVLLKSARLTAEEEEEVKNFVRFLRSKR